MIANNKILPVALIAALLGGTAGAFVMRPSKVEDAPASAMTRQLTPVVATPGSLATSPATVDGALAVNAENGLSDVNANEQVSAYRQGFAEGVRAARDEELVSPAETTRSVTASRVAAPATRVVYRNGRTRYARQADNSRRVYSDYNDEPRQRSFWSKHRDKLTVAAGAGGGAIIGGLIGGKKGAAIGAITGGGGSALYTYKIRKKNRNY